MEQPDRGEAETRPLHRSADARLTDVVASAIARPKVAAADSFVLHAPLELLARTALLPLVDAPSREAARGRIAWLGATYAASGAELDPPPVRRFASPAAARDFLASAVVAGDLDDADAGAAALADTATPVELQRLLSDLVVPLLSAAAHGSIFLYQLPRVAPCSRVAPRMLRGLARELAREHDWTLTWQVERSPAVAPTADLVERLRRPPSPGDPGSSFIYPIMSLVERSGLARQMLDSATRALDVATATRLLGRVAAWSMLQDDPDQAPYGWSHCLTMPQAVLGVAPACADPRAAIAVAATHVLGFRATLGRVRLEPALRPERLRGDLLDGIAGTPAEAAAAAWHTPADDTSRLVTALATRAALHEDAHLAKYTVACFDAAAADPEASRLFLAAAAYLSAWWRRHDAASAAS